MRRILMLVDRPLGARCLDEMAGRGTLPCGVVSRPDDEAQWWGRPAFEARSRDLGVPWYDHRGSLHEAARRSRAEFLVSVLFTRIVPSDLLARTPGVNLHCAPLPRHAGFNASLWAILGGERRFGASLHVLTEQVDAGPIVAKEEFPIPSDVTNAELYAMAQGAGLRIFARTLAPLLEGPVESTPQRGRRRYHARSLPSREADASWPLERIDRYARAFHFPPFEPAYLARGSRRIHLVPQTRHVDDAELRRWGLGGPAPR